MRRRPFGRTGLEVSALGYGAMALSLPGRPSETDAAQLLGLVRAQGVSLCDTADTYCAGPDDLHHNERMLARMAESEAGVAGGPWLIATKGGTRRTAEGWQVDGSPDRLYQAMAASHLALGGREAIPLWQLHWPDPRYSIAALLRPVERALEERLIRYAGVCNFSVAQLRQARDAVPLVSVQNQYNFWHREAETEGVLEYCEQHDLVFLPWRPLGGAGLSQRLGEIGPLAELARERGFSPQRLVIAWQLAKSKCILPIPGSRQRDHILDCLAAAEVHLEPSEIRRLDAVAARDLPRRDRPAAWEERPPLAGP